MNTSFNLSTEDIKALKELQTKQIMQADAETIIRKYGYHIGEVIDYDNVVDMLVEALSR